MPPSPPPSRHLPFSHPCVYALWKVPHPLLAFVVKGGEVPRYVIGGVDLMFPGISIGVEGLPEFSVGEIWVVIVLGNPAPIAVGSTCISSSDALKAGLCGKALKISHHYRDALWESADDRYVANVGFLEDAVFGDPSLFPNSQQSDTDATSDHENNADDGQDSSYRDSSSSMSSDPNDDQQITTDFGDLKVTKNDQSEKVTADEQNTLSVKDVDALLDKCLLQACYTTLKDKDLPIAGSTLWALQA